MSNILDISIDQGSTKTITFNIKDSGGAAFILTGYDARLQVRRSLGDTNVLVNCTLANGKLVLTNAAGGVLTLVLGPSDTSSIRFNSVEDETLDCVYDLEIQSTLGEVAKPARGAFTITREITR